MKNLLYALVLSAFLGLLAGCAIIQGQDLSDDPTSDEGITAIANSRLNSDAMVAQATLNVTVENGMAVLYGVVPDEATRQRAIQILQGTDGIFDVLDRTRRR